MRANKQDSEQGFTLIELLVVILIIGVLSAIAIPAFLNQRKAAHDATVKNDIKNIAVTIQTLPSDAKKIAKVATTAGDKAITKMSYFSAGVLKYADVPISEGVWWTVSGTSEEYCVVGYHLDGDEYTPSKPLTYDSTAGGLGRTGNACNPEDILDETGQIVATGNLVDDPLLEKLDLPTPKVGQFQRVLSYYSAPFSTVTTSTPVGTNKAIQFISDSTERRQGVIFLHSKEFNGVPVAKAGEKWMASAYVKADAGVGVMIGMRVMDINGGYSGEYGKVYVGTGEWERISVAHHSKTAEIGYYPGLQIITDERKAGTKVQVSGPMIEKSATLSPFSTH